MTDPTGETFKWTNQTTKLLLDKYNERKLQFRDPKIKKKHLWVEIVQEFKAKNHHVNEDILDRKMRNLKKSYRNIVDNNKKTTTGRGRITWEWYEIMEDIFREDRTINIGPTLSSMTVAPDNRFNNIPNFVASSTLTSTYDENTSNSNDSDIGTTEQFTENEQSDRYVNALM